MVFALLNGLDGLSVNACILICARLFHTAADSLASYRWASSLNTLCAVNSETEKIWRWSARCPGSYTPFPSTTLHLNNTHPVSTTGNTADKHGHLVNSPTITLLKLWAGSKEHFPRPSSARSCKRKLCSDCRETRPWETHLKDFGDYYNVKLRNRVTWSRNLKEEAVVLIFRKVLSKHQGSSHNVETNQNVT